MLEYNDITSKKIIILDGEPYEVLSSHVFRKQQRKPVNQTKLKNLITGKVTERSFHQSESAHEALLSTKPITFIYSRGNEVWFFERDDRSKRFSLPRQVIGGAVQFLKENMEIEALVFDEKIISIQLPVKLDLKVTEAPPHIKGATAQGGNKQVVLETGATVTVPMFINAGDSIRINTETGEYTERVEKK